MPDFFPERVRALYLGVETPKGFRLYRCETTLDGPLGPYGSGNEYYAIANPETGEIPWCSPAYDAKRVGGYADAKAILERDFGGAS